MKSLLFIKAISLVLLFALIYGLQDDKKLIESQSTLISDIPNYHICLDTTHLTCDGNCECDGLGCE